MGWSFRKSFRIGKGLRFNLSKRGLGWSIGGKLLRLGFGGGRTRVSSGFGPFRYQKTLSPGAAPASKGGCGCLTLIVAVLAVGGITSLFHSQKPPSTGRANRNGEETSRPEPRSSSARLQPPSIPENPVQPAPTNSSSPPTARLSNAPRPLPTGHAADAAKWRAVALYPRLGIADSPLNRAFLARVRRYQSERPEIFDNPEWATLIARECATELGQ